jgi:predicted outer membrane protein
MGAAALALLAGCRTDGERGSQGRNEPPTAGQGATQGATQGTPRQGGEATVGAADTMTPRMLAVVQAKTQAEIDLAKTAADKATGADVKDFARKVAADLQPSLDALNDAAKAHGIDLGAAGVQADPLVKAERAAGADDVQRLSTLTGGAFDASYLTSAVQRLGDLSQLAHQGAAAMTRTSDAAGVLQKIAMQAHERAQKARTLMPKACGGEQS